MDFFEGCGVPLKVERGRRVFPVSDKASDIVRALTNRCREVDVEIRRGKVTDILTENGSVTGVVCNGQTESFDSVIVCTGGRSYPGTGSDGDGYKFAKAFSHKVEKLIK